MYNKNYFKKSFLSYWKLVFSRSLMLARAWWGLWWVAYRTHSRKLSEACLACWYMKVRVPILSPKTRSSTLTCVLLAVPTGLSLWSQYGPAGYRHCGQRDGWAQAFCSDSQQGAEEHVQDAGLWITGRHGACVYTCMCPDDVWKV